MPLECNYNILYTHPFQLKEFESPVPKEELSVVLIEKQAVLQVLIQKIAENPEVSIQRVSAIVYDQ